MILTLSVITSVTSSHLLVSMWIIRSCCMLQVSCNTSCLYIQLKLKIQYIKNMAYTKLVYTYIKFVIWNYIMEGNMYYWFLDRSPHLSCCCSRSWRFSGPMNNYEGLISVKTNTHAGSLSLSLSCVCVCGGGRMILPIAVSKNIRTFLR